MNMKKLSLIFFAITAIAVSSCKDNVKQAEPEVVTVETTETKTYEIAQIEAEFNDPKVEAVFEQYLQVEAALVNTDAAKTATEAAKLELLLKEMDADETTQNAVAAMAGSEDIKIQRENFEPLSMGMEEMLQGSLKSGMLYKQYCPMAFNNKGAYWISSSKEILNPYFGDKMLKCGRVDAEVK
jgi:ABC-type metal ion transport system substrate-binding protein